MHKLLVLFPAILFAGALSAQQAKPSSLLEHAIALTPYVEATDQSGVWRFKQDSFSSRKFVARLADAIGLSPSAGFDDIADQLELNPYLAGQVANPKIIVPSNWMNAEKRLGSRAPAYQPHSPSGGGLSVTTLADGFAKFLVARTKEELSITFFEKFQEEVAKDPMRSLFPATSATLGVIGKDIYQFNTYLEGMRESFEKDLRVLPANLNGYVQNNDVFKQPFRQVLAEDLLDVSQQLIDGISPDSILMFLGSAAAIQDTVRRSGMSADQKSKIQNLASGLQLVDLLSSSLRSPEANQIWYPPAAVDQALRNPVTLYLYLGLLWNQGQQLVLEGKKFTDVLADANKIDDMRRTFKDFCRYGQEVNRILMEAPEEKNREDQSGYDRFYRFNSAFLNLLETGTRFKIQISGIAKQSTATDTMFLKGLQSLNELHYDVRQRHYAAAVNDLIFVLDVILQNDFSYRAKLFKYGHFIANIAEAEASDQVQAAIEAVALPPGSARLKKESKWSLSLNAYTGLMAGSERLDKTGNEAFGSLSAPLGLGINRGFSGKQSLSLYLSILDVGALAAFRFNDPVSNDLPELKFSNIFAPGAYAVWGFRPNWPIVLGVGGQRGPNLRKINDPTRPDIKEDSGWRIGAFLSVDIPVFNFWSGN